MTLIYGKVDKGEREVCADKVTGGGDGLGYRSQGIYSRRWEFCQSVLLLVRKFLTHSDTIPFPVSSGGRGALGKCFPDHAVSRTAIIDGEWDSLYALYQRRIRR